MTEVLQQLIDFLEKAAPSVWVTLVRQAYVEGAANLAWAFGFIATAVGLVVLVKYCKKQYDDDPDEGWDIGVVLFSAMALAFAVFAFGLVISAVQHFLNPEYYAIKIILEQLGQ